MEFLRGKFSKGLVRALLFVALLLLAAMPARAQPAPALELYEQKIKAGLVYNFLKYTTWPESSLQQAAGLRVCMIGEGNFSDYLYPLKGRTAQQRGIDIAQIRAPGGADGCHLLFIHRNQEGALPEILGALKGKPVLTVSDIDSFARRGGMIELALLNQRVALRINARAVASGGISIQPRLMKLAGAAG